MVCVFVFVCVRACVRVYLTSYSDCLTGVAGELCKLARVTGPEFPPPLLSSPTLPASNWPVPRGAV